MSCPARRSCGRWRGGPGAERGLAGGRAMRLLEQFLFWVHGLSAAAWFGAIFYRAAVIDPKAFGYFRERADYERFSTYLAHGMRYLVVAGLLVCGLSGFALVGLKWDGESGLWLGLMVAK